MLIMSILFFRCIFSPKEMIYREIEKKKKCTIYIAISQL